MTIVSNAGIVYNKHPNVDSVFFKRILHTDLVVDVGKNLVECYIKSLMKKDNKSGVFNKDGSFVQYKNMFIIKHPKLDTDDHKVNISAKFLNVFITFNLIQNRICKSGINEDLNYITVSDELRKLLPEGNKGLYVLPSKLAMICKPKKHC